MSAPPTERPADPLALAHELAQLAALLPGPDNIHRQALAAIKAAIVPWWVDPANANKVQVSVAELAGPAFVRETDFGRPECWLLGAVSALLGAHTAIAIEQPAEPSSILDFPPEDIAAATASHLLMLCATVARQAPSVLPKGVTPKQYKRASEAVAQRIEDIGSVAMRRTFSPGTPLQ